MRVVLYLLFASTLGYAQSVPPTPANQPVSQPAQTMQEPEVKIKTYTKLVEVPVIVTDRSGKHVTGLTKDDFALLEDKAEKKIATFEYVSTTSAPVAFKKLPPGTYSNLLIGGEGQRAISIIVMDAVNTAFPDQAYARYQLIKYLTGKIEPGTLISLMVMTRSGVKVIHDYTTDTSVLIKALQKMKSRSDSPTSGDLDTRSTFGIDPSQSQVDQEASDLEDFAQNADNTYQSFQRGVAMADTLATMESIANSLAGIPGRKSLIWATGSFPFYFDDTKGSSSFDFQPRMAKLFQKLNDGNIAIYPVDVRGLVNTAYLGPDQKLTRAQVMNPGRLQTSRSNAFRNTLDTLKNAAEMTGGVAYYNTNDIAGAVRKAQEDASSYYLLGYYLTGTEDAKPKWHKLDVKAKRAGLKIRARNGVFSTSTTQAVNAKKADLNVAERSPLPYTAMAMVVKWPGYVSGSAAQGFEVRLDSNDLQLVEPDNDMNLEILAVARDAEGKLLDQVNQTITGKIKKVDEFRSKPLVITNQFKLTSAPVTVRFIARDNHSGKMGSVIVTVPTIK